MGEPKEKENEKDGQSREMRVLDSCTPYMTERAIRCVDFSPYGDTIACASEDHRVHILELPKECRNRRKTTSTKTSPQTVGSNQKKGDSAKKYSQFDPVEHLRS